MSACPVIEVYCLAEFENYFEGPVYWLAEFEYHFERPCVNELGHRSSIDDDHLDASIQAIAWMDSSYYINWDLLILLLD